MLSVLGVTVIIFDLLTVNEFELFYIVLAASGGLLFIYGTLQNRKWYERCTRQDAIVDTLKQPVWPGQVKQVITQRGIMKKWSDTVITART